MNNISIINKNWYRAAGILSVTAAFILIISDLFLTYSPNAGAIDMLDMYVLEFSIWRLYIGALLGVFFVPFYLLGYWLIFRALRPAGFWYSFPVLIITGYVITLGFSQVHSFFGIRGIILQTGYSISNDFINYYKPIIEKLNLFEMPIVFFTYILGIFLPSLCIMIVILVKKTYYKKWMAFFNVTIIFILFYLSKFISLNIYNFLLDISINTGHLLLFLMPTIIFWNGERKLEV